MAQFLPLGPQIAEVVPTGFDLQRHPFHDLEAVALEADDLGGLAALIDSRQIRTMAHGLAQGPNRLGNHRRDQGVNRAPGASAEAPGARATMLSCPKRFP